MRAILDDRARVQRMLDFAIALARAQAQVGIVPALAVERIAEASRRWARPRWPLAISPSR